MTAPTSAPQVTFASLEDYLCEGNCKNPGMCNGTETTWCGRKAEGILQAIKTLRPSPDSEGVEAVQDTWFMDRRLPIMAMSGDHESDRVLKLHFRRKVSDDDRKRLINVLNAGELALSIPPQASAGERGVTDAMIAAAIEAAWPGPEIIYSDEFDSAEAMMRAALEAAFSATLEPGRGK